MNSFSDDRDDDDEVRLPSRGAERRSATQQESHGSEQDREFTLSTGTVLGIFFALALVCAVFFGFGYTMGRKSGQATAEANAPVPAASGDTVASKPSPGAPAIQAIPGYLSQSEADAANRSSATQTYKAPVTTGAATSVIVPTPAPTKPARAAAAAPTTEEAVSPATKPLLAPEKKAAPANAIAPVATVAGGSNYVQVAAVSHQEDAEVLLSALKRRGYAVFTRPGETDKLIHVQVGPFASKKDADAMRQRLLGDGYNAIVK